MVKIKNITVIAFLSLLVLCGSLLLFPLTPRVKAQSQQTVQVEISGFKFEPATINVAPGTRVVWTNKDSVAHTVTSSQIGVFDSGLLQQGQSFEFTFTRPGTFEYACQPHPFMRGNVEVQERATTGAVSSSVAARSAPSTPAMTSSMPDMAMASAMPTRAATTSAMPTSTAAPATMATGAAVSGSAATPVVTGVNNPASSSGPNSSGPGVWPFVALAVVLLGGIGAALFLRRGSGKYRL